MNYTLFLSSLFILYSYLCFLSFIFNMCNQFYFVLQISVIYLLGFQLLIHLFSLISFLNSLLFKHCWKLCIEEISVWQSHCRVCQLHCDIRQYIQKIQFVYFIIQISVIYLLALQFHLFIHLFNLILFFKLFIV